jgi:16S rRNA C967 or C1407 C5-methylase (RsmB/RsmF family)
LFKEGYFEIQDEGSQLMSAFSLFPGRVSSLLSERPVTEKRDGLDPFPATLRSEPLTFVDACAGAGGKTLAVCDLLAGKGRVFAYDISEKKIRGLRERIGRSGDRNVKAIALPPVLSDELKGFENKADRVLIDAPCSGLGVSRRNPDAKWNRKPRGGSGTTVEKPVTDLQAEVLRTYASLVRSGGRLIYGVCTFGKNETVEKSDQFLASHPDFALEARGFTGPRDTDGFFMASFRKH